MLFDPSKEMDAHRIHTIRSTNGRQIELWLGEAPTSYVELGHEVIVNLTAYTPATTGNRFGGIPSTSPGQVLIQLPYWDALEGSAELPPKELFLATLQAINLLVLASSETRQLTRVYFHCAAGINRSSLALALYLNHFCGLTPEEAIKLIRTKRYEDCLSNRYFEKLVGEWGRE